MKDKIISTIKELPHWFDIKKYAHASIFGWSEWRYELEIRLRLRNAWREHHALATTHRGLPDCWERIKQHGLVSLEEEDTLSPPSTSLADTDEKEIALMSIATLTNFRVYGFYWFHPYREEIDKYFSLSFSWPDNKTSAKTRKNAGAWLYERCTGHPLGDGKYFEAARDGTEPSVYIEVDLNASDEQIKKDFTEWLNHERQLQKRPIPKKNFTPADFASWHEASILPYLDLMFWSEIENAKIQQHVIAQAIYPDAYALGSNVDPLGKLKTTKKKAEYLLSKEAFNVLDLQVEE